MGYVSGKCQDMTGGIKQNISTTDEKLTVSLARRQMAVCARGRFKRIRRVALCPPTVRRVV